MIKKTKKTNPLPKTLEGQWKTAACLSIKNDREVYLLKGINHKDTAVLKLFYKKSFSKKKYKKTLHLPETHFVLPMEHHYLSGTHYILYPECRTLKDLLLKDGISLWELFSLGIDLADAVIMLCEHHIYEADISPHNILQNDKGTFCLGDINLQTAPERGSSGYIAPEQDTAGRRPLSKTDFDKATQYSICRLLYCIYTAKESVTKESAAKESTEAKTIADLFVRGMQERPEQRYDSLHALREELQKQQKRSEAQRQYQCFQIKEMDHSLFHTKTLPAVSKEKPLLYPIVWGMLVIAGCIFLTALYRNLHAGDYTAQNGIYLSQMAQATSMPASAIPAEQPQVSDDTRKTEELDFRKRDLTSLSFPHTAHPERVTCLYAGENRLTDTSAIQQFTKLKELYLDSNHIKKLSGISSLNELEILVLSYNQLTSLPDLSALVSLRHLDISSNENFKDFDSLIRLTELTTLNIAGTGITEKQYRELCRTLRGCVIVY